MFTFSQLLSQENLGEVFIDGDINLIFNNFLNTYLRIYNASFPISKREEYIKSNPWITPGIKISGSTKRHLYVKYKESMDQRHKAHYKKYCTKLSSVIRRAKKMYYDTVIQKSTNKIRATWDIVKTLTNSKSNNKNLITKDKKRD